jgi:fucokinase
MSFLGLAPAALSALQQAYRHNWTHFTEALAGLSAGARPWDYVVLTASNAHQAEAYEIQLQERRDADQLPAHTQFRVYADPDGRRIGSGGATLRVQAVGIIPCPANVS